MNRLAMTRGAAALAAALAFAGCFDEPVPAYKTVAPETRVYLKEKGLETLTAEAVLKQGLVFVHGSGYTNLSALVSGDFDPKSLEYLNLDRNALKNVDALGEFTSLKWLRLNGNALESLPDLSGMKNLRRLYLSGNALKSVPETVKDLPSLTDLDLSGNPIETLPDWLAKKEGLEHLSLTRTKIKSLPDDLSAWKSLKSLQLGDIVGLGKADMERIRAALPGVTVVF
jgi:Leucine-rich repeat (LRR) protein